MPASYRITSGEVALRNFLVKRLDIYFAFNGLNSGAPCPCASKGHDNFNHFPLPRPLPLTPNTQNPLLRLEQEKALCWRLQQAINLGFSPLGKYEDHII